MENLAERIREEGKAHLSMIAEILREARETDAIIERTDAHIRLGSGIRREAR